MSDLFFKYVTAKTALKILKYLSFRFSSPKLFNDPFDCDISFSIDLDKLKKLYFPGLIKDKMNSYFTEDYIKDVEKIYNESETRKNLQNDFYKNAIFCVSKNQIKSNLMWSHYAEGHTGCAFSIYPCNEESIFRLLLPVSYSSKKPVLDITNTNEQYLQDFIKKIIYSKSEIWSYENEYRVFLPEECSSNDYYDYKFGPLDIRGIYFGCMISNDNRNEIESVVSSSSDLHHLQLYQCSKDPFQYNLIIDEVQKY